MNVFAFFIGAAFGAALLLGALAEPNRIIGTLRLRDFHAMRTIAVFILVSMLGVWVLEMAGVANMSPKPAALVANLLGGALLGVGFGLTGYCPGTGLACAAAGRLDALVSVAGMLAGALVFILVQPSVVAPIAGVANYGKKMLPELTGVPRPAWVIPIFVIGAAALYLTRPGTKQAPAPDAGEQAEGTTG